MTAYLELTNRFSLCKRKMKDWKFAPSIVIFLAATYSLLISSSLQTTYAQNILKSIPPKQNSQIAMNSRIILRSNTNQYPIKYHLTNGIISAISIEKDNTTLLLNVSSVSNGTLIIELPRNVIDSKGPGNADNNFTVFEDGQYVSYNEIGTNSKSRIITLTFDNNPSVIEITGTRTVPEFASMTIVILAISIAGLVICGRKLALTEILG